MKKIFSILFVGLALLPSCMQEDKITGPVNDISDNYTVPTEATVMPQLTAHKSTWSVNRRYFDLTFGEFLKTTLVGYDALLTPGQYVLGADEIGNAILKKTTVNGNNAKEGFITVTKKEGQYVITAQIDGQVLTWTGTLDNFKADPAPLQLNVLQQAQKNTGLVTLQLASAEFTSEFDPNTWQTVLKGDGKYLAIDIYSSDGYLHDGEYTPCEVPGVINEGEFGVGWDPGDLYGVGMIFTDWGTCLWTVTPEGNNTAEKITSGLVTVSSREEENATIWTIYWGVDYPVQLIFEGAIPALTKPKPVNTAPTHTYTEDDLQPVTDQQGAVVAGVLKHPIHIWDKDNNEVAYLELLIAEGNDDYTGSYPSTSYASAAGQMADGWEFDATAWGMGIMSGGSYYINDSGEKVLLTAGTVTVEVAKIATGAYRFTCQYFDYPAAGPDYVPSGDGDDDVTGDVVLKLTSGLTYTKEDVTAANTDASSNPLSGVTLWRVTVSDASGVVAAFDLGTDAGSENLAGTYTVMSYPDAVGKAGNGWGFAAWNYFGGCYFVVDGAYYFIPADATITVTDNGGLLKIRFEGPVQKDDYSDGGQGGLLLNNVAKA